MSLDTRIAKVTGRAVPVPGNDIDTDRIMPARYLKCVSFENIGKFAFQDERFDPEGRLKDHPFNCANYHGAGVLIVNKNFGCGSSREHAPQGLLRWGIKAIIGETFAEIFAGNCTAIGLPTVTAGEDGVKALMAHAREHPDASLEIDLEKKQVSYGNARLSVEMKESSRTMFLDGTWDSTATLLSAGEALRRTADRIPYIAWLGK